MKNKTIRFTVTPEEKIEIWRYVTRKKKWRTPSDFARFAVFSYMTRNPTGSHPKGRDGPVS